MSDYDKLAQRIVVLGIGEVDNHTAPTYFCPGDTFGVVAEAFCKDGRVVLALMEKCGNDCLRITKSGPEWHVGRIIDYDEVTDCDAFSDSLALAIVLAALKGADGGD